MENKDTIALLTSALTLLGVIVNSIIGIIRERDRNNVEDKKAAAALKLRELDIKERKELAEQAETDRRRIADDLARKTDEVAERQRKLSIANAQALGTRINEGTKISIDAYHVGNEAKETIAEVQRTFIAASDKRDAVQGVKLLEMKETGEDTNERVRVGLPVELPEQVSRIEEVTAETLDSVKKGTS